jgi:hypothetical protein
MDTLFRDKIDNNIMIFGGGVWDWLEMRDLGRSTSDTWERVIADSQITGRTNRESRDLDDKANMIHKKKDYQIQAKGEVGKQDQLGWSTEMLWSFRGKDLWKETWPW